MRHFKEVFKQNRVDYRKSDKKVIFCDIVSVQTQLRKDFFYSSFIFLQSNCREAERRERNKQHYISICARKI